MTITEITIHPTTDPTLKAYVSIVFDGRFVVRDLKIIEIASKRFVAMPSKRMKDGSFKDTAHPLDPQTRAEIETAVFDAYAKALQTSPPLCHDTTGEGPDGSCLETVSN